MTSAFAIFETARFIRMTCASIAPPARTKEFCLNSHFSTPEGPSVLSAQQFHDHLTHLIRLTEHRSAGLLQNLILRQSAQTPAQSPRPQGESVESAVFPQYSSDLRSCGPHSVFEWQPGSERIVALPYLGRHQ